MISVTGVKPHHSGFNQFQRDVESVEYPEFDSIEEYAEYVTRTNYQITGYAVDPDIAEMGDEDGQALAKALRAANGNVQGGHETLVAFALAPDGDGEIAVLLESVVVLE